MNQLPYEPLFWKYLVEREAIRLRRLHGEPQGRWTDDPIMRDYSFTNVKRHHDRVTTLLRRKFYDNCGLKHPSKIALLNAALFRYHGTVKTAEFMGWQTNWSEEIGKKLARANEIRIQFGRKVFTGAYIVPSGGVLDPKTEIVRVVVNQIWKNADRILTTDSWREACRSLCLNWCVGEFMAKEVLLDYMLATEWTPSDWQTWTPIGPGAQRGAGVVRTGSVEKISKSRTLDVCLHLFRNRDESWPHEVKLDLTDIQFALCELAKYRKAQTGVGRPKKRFQPTVDDVTKG